MSFDSVLIKNIAIACGRICRKLNRELTKTKGMTACVDLLRTKLCIVLRVTDSISTFGPAFSSALPFPAFSFNDASHKLNFPKKLSSDRHGCPCKLPWRPWRSPAYFFLIWKFKPRDFFKPPFHFKNRLKFYLYSIVLCCSLWGPRIILFV